jgi:PAS domain S-box-containing protein
MVDNKALLASILDYVPLHIFIADAQGGICFANRYAQQTLGYAQQELYGAPLEQFMHSSGHVVQWQRVQDALGKNPLYLNRIDFAAKGGRSIICDLTAHLLVEANSDTVVVILRDITRELSDAEELESKNLEMAKMNSELIRSNAQLKRVSEMKSNFLSIASHELKTPLTSIKGYSDIIMDTMEGKLDGAIYRMIGSINRAADRLHQVVNNILDVTRIEQKRLRLRPEELDLAKVASDCIDDLAQFSSKRSISFKCAFENNLPPFYGDKMRIQQVFTNLFTNALKFSPDNATVEVSIKLVETTAFLIAVRDSGIGINGEEQKKIFHPFYEVGSINRHSTDSSKFMGGGTGLGLSIVKGIVERHGGRIWVASEGVRENEFPGSTFFVELPCHPHISWDDDESRLSLAEEKADEPQRLIDASAAVDTKPVILFIDSDKEAVEIGRMVLEKAFEVIVAEDGENGLRLAFTHNPALVLLDTYLPGLDGYRICRILRSQDETRDLPIAFFSAGTQTDEIQRGFVCGADDFIVKPFGGQELVEKIWRLLMKKKERDQLL